MVGDREDRRTKTAFPMARFTGTTVGPTNKLPRMCIRMAIRASTEGSYINPCNSYPRLLGHNVTARASNLRMFTTEREAGQCMVELPLLLPHLLCVTRRTDSPIGAGRELVAVRIRVAVRAELISLNMKPPFTERPACGGSRDMALFATNPCMFSA
jgi:hypothetical protein